MAYPTPPTEPITEIATDATYNAPGDDWDGADTKVAPTAAIEDQGYVPGDPRPADVDNWLFNSFAKWLSYLSDFVDELKLQKVQGPASSTDNAVARFDSTSGKIVQNSALICADTTGVLTYGTAQTTTRIFGITASEVEGGTWAFAGGIALSSTDTGVISLPISEWLPDGAVITDIDVMVDPGTTRSTSGNRTRYQFKTRTYAFGTPSTGSESDVADVRDDGTTNLQVVAVLDASTYTLAQSSGHRAWLRITSGNDGGGHVNDSFFGVRVTWKDPGPSARA